MITKLNLASHPFRNRTLPYLLALFLLVLAAVGALFGLATLDRIRSQNELIDRNNRELETELQSLNQKGEAVQQELSPDQRLRLVGAHKLVAARAFGWSRLFADLERVLPNGVSASRITVENVFKDGDLIKAELDFAVLSRDYQSVAQLIDNMNNSGVFRADLRGQDLQKTDRLTFTEFTLRLVYSQNYAPNGVSSETLVTQNQEDAQR